jgi:hypothetical protein
VQHQVDGVFVEDIVLFQVLKIQISSLVLVRVQMIHYKNKTSFQVHTDPWKDVGNGSK